MTHPNVINLSNLQPEKAIQCWVAVHDNGGIFVRESREEVQDFLNAIIDRDTYNKWSAPRPYNLVPC